MILAAAMSLEGLTGDREIARLRQGDPDTITELIGRYQHRLYRFLVRMVGDPATAEDLFQQTWIRLMEKIGSYDAQRNFEAWLFAIARNLAMHRSIVWRRLDRMFSAG
jgi:RNA polymerase sigma-70 factor (ECF subfamily)